MQRSGSPTSLYINCSYLLFHHSHSLPRGRFWEAVLSRLWELLLTSLPTKLQGNAPNVVFPFVLLSDRKFSKKKKEESSLLPAQLRASFHVVVDFTVRRECSRCHGHFERDRKP